MRNNGLHGCLPVSKHMKKIVLYAILVVDEYLRKNEKDEKKKKVIN